ncbi:hypothetical protein O988_03181 [Pseudogymnoascus sp. VKM F-3808]|nr:hypothetical protein O988_03181 [Pseudogymnoascus sp. VKM F-3808]
MAKAKQAKGANVPHKALHSRLSYLYQAATYLSAQEKPSTASAIPTPPPVPSQPHLQNAGDESDHHHELAEPQPASSQNLSRLLLSDLRTVSMKMQIRLSPGMKHTICKRCDMLLQDGSTCVTKVENKSKNGRKPWADVLVRTCANCGCEKRFPVNAERQPRRPNRVSKAAAQVGYEIPTRDDLRKADRKSHGMSLTARTGGSQPTLPSNCAEGSGATAEVRVCHKATTRSRLPSAATNSYHVGVKLDMAGKLVDMGCVETTDGEMG